MEIKATLQKPYTEEERMSFIVQYNHQLGYKIEETKNELQALGYTEEELEQQKKERIARLKLTRGDVFRGLLQARGITRSYIREIIEKLPAETTEEHFKKEMALIDFDEALDFYRGNELITAIGLQLEITPEQLDNFFRYNDYKFLLKEQEV